MRGARAALWLLFAVACRPATTPADAGDEADVVVIVAFDATPSEVASGEPITLSWQTRSAAGCGVEPGHPAVPRSGDLIVAPASSTLFTLVCTGLGGPASAEVEVVVRAVTDDAGPGRDDDAGPAPDAGPLMDGGYDAGLDDDDAGPVHDAGIDDDAGAHAGPPWLRELPLHRWSFAGQSDDELALDSYGDAHGLLVAGATLTDGRLQLDGVSGYLDLPNGLISSLPALTFEAWLEWAGPAQGTWQRVFDFGSNSAGEIAPEGDAGFFTGANDAFIQLTPQNGAGFLRFTLDDGAGEGQDVVLHSGPLASGQVVHVVATHDPAAGEARVFLNGSLIGEVASTQPLSTIDDVNVWLGRSNFSVDPRFDGAYDEVRLYDYALDEDEVAESFIAGPDGL